MDVESIERTDVLCNQLRLILFFYIVASSLKSALMAQNVHDLDMKMSVVQHLSSIRRSLVQINSKTAILLVMSINRDLGINFKQHLFCTTPYMLQYVSTWKKFLLISSLDRQITGKTTSTFSSPRTTIAR